MVNERRSFLVSRLTTIYGKDIVFKTDKCTMTGINWELKEEYRLQNTNQTNSHSSGSFKLSVLDVLRGESKILIKYAIGILIKDIPYNYKPVVLDWLDKLCGDMTRAQVSKRVFKLVNKNNKIFKEGKC